MTVVQDVDGRLLPAGVPPTESSYIVTSGGTGSIELANDLAATFEVIYETNPICAAVVNKLARQIATLPLKVFDSPADQSEANEIPTHPLAKLLRTPAPRRGANYWKQALVRSQLVHGNGLLAKWRGPTMKGPPQALLPCQWPYVAAWATIGTPVEWWSTFQTGEQRFFEVEDSVHYAWLSENPNELGVSPLRQLAMTIKLDDASRRYMSSSFANGARPSGAIVPPPDFRYQDGQKKELSDEIRRTHGGVDNAFKIALLAPGFDWKPFSHTAVESEVVAARQLNREEFAMAYDIPPPMIQDFTHGTYSNVEETHRILYVTTLRPPISLLEEVLQAQLIDSEPTWAGQGIFVRFDLTDVLRGNRREEIDAMSEAFNNGLMTLNECRKQLGLNPYNADDHPLADEPHVRTNNTKPLSATQPETDPAAETDPNTLKPKPPVPAKPIPTRTLPETPSSGEET